MPAFFSGYAIRKVSCWLPIFICICLLMWRIDSRLADYHISPQRHPVSNVLAVVGEASELVLDNHSDVAPAGLAVAILCAVLPSINRRRAPRHHDHQVCCNPRANTRIYPSSISLQSPPPLAL
jgi:hypothetical protein